MSSDAERRPLLSPQLSETEELHSPRPNLYGSETAENGEQYRDLAAILLLKFGESPSAHPAVSPDDEKRVRRLTKRQIIPLLLGISFVNLLHTVPLEYELMSIAHTEIPRAPHWGWTSVARWMELYGARLVAQLPWSYALVRFPLNKTLPYAICGSATCFMVRAMARNETVDMVVQVLLGLFSAALEPGIIAITQLWWRRREQTKVLGAVYLFNAAMLPFFFIALAGPEADSNLKKDIPQMLLYAVTMLVGAAVNLFLPISPVESKFFTYSDKVTIIHSLYTNQMGILPRKRTWRYPQFVEACLDVKVWLWACLICAVTIPSTGLTAKFGRLFPVYDPLGLDEFGTGALIALFYIFAMAVAFAWATKSRRKAKVIVVACVPPLLYCFSAAVLPSAISGNGFVMVPLFTMNVHVVIGPLIYVWANQNIAGDTKRKTATALITMGASVGKVFAILPFIAAGYSRENLTAENGAYVGIFLFVIILTAVTTSHLRRLNTLHATARDNSGTVQLFPFDLSLHTSQDEFNARHEETGTASAASDGSAANVKDMTYMDATDAENNDFYYVI